MKQPRAAATKVASARGRASTRSRSKPKATSTSRGVRKAPKRKPARSTKKAPPRRSPAPVRSKTKTKSKTAVKVKTKTKVKTAIRGKTKVQASSKTKTSPVGVRHRVWIPESIRADGTRVRGHYRLQKGAKKRPARPKKSAKPLGLPATLPPPRAPKVKPKKQAIALPEEILEQRLLRFRRRLRKQNKIKPPRGHDFGDTWFSRIDQNLVLHRNVVIAMLVNDENMEEIVHRVMTALRSALLIMSGTMYASLYLYEYGRQIIGSPGEMFFEDADGFMWESFRGVPASATLASFEIRLRAELENQAAHVNSSVWFEHATVRIARQAF